MFRILCRTTTTVVQYLYNNPKDTQDNNDRNIVFGELVILVVKTNGDLSEANGYYCAHEGRSCSRLLPACGSAHALNCLRCMKSNAYARQFCQGVHEDISMGKSDSADK